MGFHERLPEFQGNAAPGEVLATVREMDEKERAREEANSEDLVSRHGDEDE